MERDASSLLFLFARTAFGLPRSALNDLKLIYFSFQHKSRLLFLQYCNECWLGTIDERCPGSGQEIGFWCLQCIRFNGEQAIFGSAQIWHRRWKSAVLHLQLALSNLNWKGCWSGSTIINWHHTLGQKPIFYPKIHRLKIT